MSDFPIDQRIFSEFPFVNNGYDGDFLTEQIQRLIDDGKITNIVKQKINDMWTGDIYISMSEHITTLDVINKIIHPGKPSDCWIELNKTELRLYWAPSRWFKT